MSLVIQTNIAMINAQANYKVVTGKKAKSAEALGTGYRINRAADDAAGLTISEKMRWQIRGLERGERNGQDGISWVQTGDQALAEVHDMLHRMKELTIQSLNDTNTPEDRAALQAEFDAIQSEIDRISKSTQFNTLNIFEEHEPSFYELEGNVEWPQNGIHTINVPDNQLVVEFIRTEGASPETVTITVPQGSYTTQELADEIDTALMAIPEEDLVVEYSENGTFNLCVEGGSEIKSATGGLSYLLYEMYEGGSVGSLIGTTLFAKESDRLEIVAGKNNVLTFDIEDFDGNSTSKTITLASGEYTRKELIDIFNNELAGTDVSAVAYGTGIKLTSNDKIITGFKGNMFKIDEGQEVYSSVFYDNVKYGNISMTAGTFTGGAVIPTEQRDLEHSFFEITDDNNTLTFMANGSDTPVDIVIPNGSYDIESMKDKLNELFAATLNDADSSNDLELEASVYTSGGYMGLSITSLIKGANSKVGLDSTSSAYNTLFVNREYNQYGVEKAKIENETKADSLATVTGSKSLTDEVPLKITAGVNDSFKIDIGDGQTYTITLDGTEYNTVDDIVNEIQKRINEQSGIKNLVTVSQNGGKLVLTAASGIENVNIIEIAGNQGYDDLFIEKTIKYTSQTVSDRGTSTTPASVTLNTELTNGTIIDDTNNTLEITVDNNKYTVILPTGEVGKDVTYNDIIAKIEDTIKARETTEVNTFTTVSDVGDEKNNNFYLTDTGVTKVTSASYYQEGDSQKTEGAAQAYVYNTPAKVTLSTALPSSVEIDSSNNYMLISINGVAKSITLDSKTYSASQLVTELQNKIDAAYGKYAGGATVSMDSSGKLVIEARLNTSDGGVISGKNTSISLSTAGSSFIKELHTTREPAYITTGSLNDSINITEDNNTFKFQYKKDGVMQTVELSLSKGTYTRKGFVDEINKQLKAEGVGVSASLSGNALTLTTTEVGDGNYIAYSSQNGGSCVEAAFGKMIEKYAATVTIGRDTLEKININSDGSNNSFTINVNGKDETIYLDPGEYDRYELVAELNKQFENSSIGVTASLNSTDKRLVFTTDATGSTSSLKITYSGGGTAMEAIYGTTVKKYSGVDAEFVNGMLKLTTTENGSSLSVSSTKNGILQADKIEEKETAPTTTEGYESTKKAYIDGVDIVQPIVIDQWNDELNFTYKQDSTKTYNFNIQLEHGSYTYDTLAQALQEKIDDVLSGDAGNLQVTVSADGVRIEALYAGSEYELVKNSFSGDFYDKVLCKTVEESAPQNVSVKDGNKPADTAYTIGRKDVQNNEVQIKSGVNDTLTIDLTYGGSTKTFTMKLDAGIYKGQSLADMIQEKLNEQLVNANLDENMILVGIGGIHTGVIGSNDDNALNFQLSRDANLPAEGTYIIDGVRGNAAFSVFYQTDGELIPAYTKGAKDISEGVTINPGEEGFSFDVDGQTYDITLSAGDYTADEVVDAINAQLASAPVKAELDEGKLKLSYEKLGEHTISNVRGGAMEELFFVQNSDDREESGLLIQLSSQQGDNIEIDKPIISTVSLKINSLAITQPKYANKALERLDYALEEVSEARVMFGAMQNRLEHIVRNNNNAAENIQRSESLLRDTDMAEEMVEYSKHNILQQAGQSVMSHIRVDSEGVLRLLQN